MPVLNNSICPIGLDISDLSIKLIQLKAGRDKIKIQAVGKKLLPAGLVENGEIKNKEELAKIIKELIRDPLYGRVTTDEVVTCLPDTRTFLKIIEVEKTSANLAETVKSELEKHIPSPLEELYYDWQVIRNLPRARLILIIAAEKKIVDQYADVLGAARLSVVAVETEPLSVCRALLEEEHPKYKGDAKKNYALIDIGATSASLAIYSRGTLLFSVSLPISGQAITDEIAEKMGVENSRAEKEKIIYSLNEEENSPLIKEVLEKAIDELAKKVQEAINFFNHHFSNWGLIEKIIICGGCANIKNIDKILEKKIKIETIRGNALVNLKNSHRSLLNPFKESHGPKNDPAAGKKIKKSGKKKSEEEKTSQNTCLSYTTAVGLALREIFNSE